MKTLEVDKATAPLAKICARCEQRACDSNGWRPARRRTRARGQHRSGNGNSEYASWFSGINWAFASTPGIRRGDLWWGNASSAWTGTGCGV